MDKTPVKVTLVGDATACHEDEDEHKRLRRRFIPKGLRVRLGGLYEHPERGTINAGTTFLVNAEDQLMHFVRNPEVVPFHVRYYPNRIVVNRSYYGLNDAEDTTLAE